MINLNNFLWSKIPEELGDKDSYKDVDNKGLLERFLSIFDVELQEELIIPLENFSNELSPLTASDKFLTEIAYSVGSPPDVMGGIDTYRNVLTQIISIYQIKGTIPSYRKFFNLFGLSCRITEIFPIDNLYDDGQIYDNDDIDAPVYDQNQFNAGFIEYSVEYYNLIGSTTAPLSPADELKLKEAMIQLLQPIDCKLRDFTYLPVPPEGDNDGLPLTLEFILTI